MRVGLAPDVRDLFVDGDGTAAVMAGNRVLALSVVSAAVVRLLKPHGEHGVDEESLWAQLRPVLVDLPDGVDSERVVSRLLSELADAGLVRWMAPESDG